MRITLEPSTAANASRQHKVIIETPDDDASLEEVCEWFQDVLVAYGFAYEGVREHFAPEEVWPEEVAKDAKSVGSGARKRGR